MKTGILFVVGEKLCLTLVRFHGLKELERTFEIYSEQIRFRPLRLA